VSEPFIPYGVFALAGQTAAGYCFDDARSELAAELAGPRSPRRGAVALTTELQHPMGAEPMEKEKTTIGDHEALRPPRLNQGHEAAQTRRTPLQVRSAQPPRGGNWSLLWIYCALMGSLLRRVSVLDFESGDYKAFLSNWYEFRRAQAVGWTWR
jgi:hypothetical protein